MALVSRVRDWYRGKYVPPPRNDPNSPLVFVSPGRYVSHCLSKNVTDQGRCLI